MTAGATQEIARATIADVANIVANPSQYGFAWRKHPLNKGGMELPTHHTATEITDFGTFRACFGDDLISNALDGTSLKVQEDTVVRNELWTDRNAKTQYLREQVVKRVLLGESAKRGGVKVIVREVIKYGPALDGKLYDSLLEVQQVNVGAMVEMGLTLEEAKQRLGIG